MNEKGFLLAESTLKIIIALITISFLVYFLTSLYFASKNSEKLEFAEASLNYIVQSSENEVEEIEIYNPSNWFLSSWSESETFPLICSEQGWNDCLCICKTNTYEGCTTQGVCLESDLEVENAGIKIKTPLKILIQNGEIKPIQ